MPELPEIEHLRRTLEPWLVGARVIKVNLRRRDVVRVAGSRRAKRGVKSVDLLEGCVIHAIERRGKSLAIVGERSGLEACGLGLEERRGQARRPAPLAALADSPQASGLKPQAFPLSRVLVLHMGMTGTMRVEREQGSGTDRRRTLTPALSLARPSKNGRSLSREGEGVDKHVHCEWVMERASGQQSAFGDQRIANTHRTLTPALSLGRAMKIGRSLSAEREGEGFRVMFRDPRRFGGLWPFDSLEDLHERAWRHLGPDALDIDATTLRERLLRTKMPMKAALLNQKLIAGVGNIYADEALFAARIHPLTPPRRLRDADWKNLASAIRRVLNAAIKAGGSSIRDYRDAAGNDGEFSIRHRVYGRGGLPCMRCGQSLDSRVIGQRTTVWCSRCQPSYPQAGRRSSRDSTSNVRRRGG